MRSQSRGGLRPSYADRFTLLDNRGRREGRALAAPVARLRKKMQAAGTTGLAEHARPSLRDGFDGCFAFSPVRRLLATVRDDALCALRRGTPASGCQDRAT
ncbi:MULTISPECIES: hypothetical protein [unclassified Bradyrhizobium]|uniref:hypothetical protein n=1 Tax=unclassified Bradyrhizobium TaxID=2631580 RepID=UPI0028E6361B|nr:MULTISPECIES: hypothetical protein [unclassified Bradyrhizobium]